MFKIKRDLTNYPEKDDSAKENKQGKIDNSQWTTKNILLFISVSGLFYKDSDLKTEANFFSENIF